MICKNIMMCLVLSGFGSVLTQENKTDEFLLITQPENNTIYTLDIKTKALNTLPIRDIDSPYFVSYDTEEDTVYWGQRGRLKSINIDGTNETTVRTAGYVTGIAIDVNERLLFYADSWTLEIYKMKLGTQEISTIVNASHGWAIQLDIFDKKIYWSHMRDPESVSQPTIKSANYDGSQQKDITSVTIYTWGLAIDIYDKILYWSDYYEGIIKSNIDGSNRQIVYSTDTVAILGLALYNRNTIFFASFYSNSSYINSIATTGGPISTMSTFRSTSTSYIYNLHFVSIKGIDECLSNPCLNGATCNDNVNGYNCTCVQGFTGEVCATDIDECLSAPCQNGATCNDIVNGYTCSCTPGYTNSTCATDIDECLLDPCQNGATCNDVVNGYTCSCAPGYTDAMCSTDVNECSTNTSQCDSNAVCTNTVGSYNCQIKPDCGTVPRILNGNIQAVDFANTTYGALANVICDTGYYTMMSQITCLGNGTWDISTCKIIDCGQLSSVENGDITVTSGTNYAAPVLFVCHDGYTLVGESSLQCLKSGQWSGLKPTCHKESPKTCKSNTDSRGTIWTETPVNTTAMHNCVHGFSGNITRKCTSDGVWQLPQYSCVRDSIQAVYIKVDSLKENASAADVSAALNDIAAVTAQSQNTPPDQKLTDREINMISSSLEKVAGVLSASSGVLIKNITNSFLEAASSLIDDSNIDSWKSLVSADNKGAEKMLTAVDTMGEALSKLLQNSTDTSTIIVTKNIALEVKRFTNTDVLFPDKYSNESEHKDAKWIRDSQSQIQLRASALNGENVLYQTTAVMYRDMSEILSIKRTASDGIGDLDEGDREKINGPILALSISPNITRKLNPPVTIKFQHQLVNKSHSTIIHVNK